MLFLFGAEGETRTLAPVSRPTPLAGAPRHQLEYFSIGNKTWIFCCCKTSEKEVLQSGGESGIRTHGTLPYDGFQDRSVITTSVSLHLIALIYYHMEIKMSTGFNYFFKYFFEKYDFLVDIAYCLVFTICIKKYIQKSL